ncbi:hypothetical protein BH18GEM1_BH18GEM1_03050 [soil metagenome]
MLLLLFGVLAGPDALGWIALVTPEAEDRLVAVFGRGSALEPQPVALS